MRRAIIIGASSGLGHEVAKILIKDGWQIGIAARRLHLLELLYKIAPDRVEMAAIDVTKADQNIRGMLSLPNGTGKSVRVAVFTENAADEAKKAGADVVGGTELIDSVAAGNINFDRVIATPDMMPKMSKIARVLGPKGLMPNPKLGTVTNNVADAVANAKAGQIEYRAEKKGIIHAGIGKMSFTTEKLVENANALIDQLKKVKPSTSKGQYILGISVATTQGPGLKVDAK